jgi:hypothetical protein
VLKVADNGNFYDDVPIKEGEVFLLPPHARSRQNAQLTLSTHRALSRCDGMTKMPARYPYGIRLDHHV